MIAKTAGGGLGLGLRCRKGELDGAALWPRPAPAGPAARDRRSRCSSLCHRFSASSGILGGSGRKLGSHPSHLLEPLQDLQRHPIRAPASTAEIECVDTRVTQALGVQMTHGRGGAPHLYMEIK